MKLKILERKNDIGLLILRISIGGMMLMHGINKLIKGIDGIKAMVVAQGFPSFVAYGVLVGEIIAPLLIIGGFRTRLSAAVVTFNCFVAWYMVHRTDLFTLNTKGGWAMELLGLFFFGSLTLFFTGGGKYAMSKKSMWD